MVFFPGYGEDQHPQDPDPESVHEIECLTKVNKRLAEEKASLQAELTSMEDLVQMVKDENDNLKTSLKANNNNNNQHHGSNQQDSNLETGREDDCGKGESSIGVERFVIHVPF